MRRFLLLFALGGALFFAGCEKKSAEISAKNTVETFINAKAKRNYRAMWQCLSPRTQHGCGDFEAFKKEQDETYKLLGESGWQTLVDQMRQDSDRIRVIKIDDQYYIDEK